MKSWSAVLLVSMLVVPLLALPCCAGKKAIKSGPPPAPIAEREPAVSPPPAAEPALPIKVALAFEDIRFDYDQFTLRADAEAILARHAKVLLDRPDVTIRIEGHCDERGTVEYNLALGARRAKAALDYLLAYGIPRDRMSTISYGKEKPLDQGHGEAAWARNRRAAFVVVS